MKALVIVAVILLSSPWTKVNIDEPKPLPEPTPVIEPIYELEYIGEFKVTGYDACIECCGKTDGITASGVKATVNHTVAMCKDYPFGTVIYIDGLGYYTVEDRGVGKGCVDVFCSNHEKCYAITGYYNCFIVKEG